MGGAGAVGSVAVAACGNCDAITKRAALARIVGRVQRKGGLTVMRQVRGLMRRNRARGTSQAGGRLPCLALATGCRRRELTCDVGGCGPIVAVSVSGLGSRRVNPLHRHVRDSPSMLTSFLAPGQRKFGMFMCLRST